VLENLILLLSTSCGGGFCSIKGSLVIAQFVVTGSRIKGLRFEGQTGVTGTNPTQCHHNGMVLSI
jgi:hypothetical protein